MFTFEILIIMIETLISSTILWLSMTVRVIHEELFFIIDSCNVPLTYCGMLIEFFTWVKIKNEQNNSNFALGLGGGG